jgi:hypothetical protein
MTKQRLYSDEANNGGGKSSFLFSRTLKKEELSSTVNNCATVDSGECETVAH